MKAVIFAVVMAIIGAISSWAHAQMIIEVRPIETESKFLKKLREAKEATQETPDSVPVGAPQAAPAATQATPTAIQAAPVPPIPAKQEAADENSEPAPEGGPQTLAASLPVE